MKGSKESVSLGPLKNGGRVVIIGGGPGGVSCALALHQMAAKMSRHINITIIEGKDFAGDRQYNQCVGVLSPPIVSLLEEELGLSFPYHLKRDFIQGYILHTGKECILLKEKGDPSISLRRVQFDAYMLESVKKLGIKVLRTRAVDIEFFRDQVTVYTENSPIKADVVVGAWGMDDGSATLFKRVTGYQSPDALCAIVTKYHPGEEAMARFGSNIHAFLPKNPRIEFGGITPKRNHLTINIAGKTANSQLMNVFLDMPEVRRALPNFEVAGKQDPTDLQFFKGRFPCSLAKNYYGDRYVIIGDAAGLVRAFKGKGVTSAVLTGLRAADVILRHGISSECFAHYYKTANQEIIQDFPYGRIMRFLTIFLSRLQLLDPVVRAAHHNQVLRDALYGAVSAHDSYRNVLFMVIKSLSFASILSETIHGYMGSIRYHKDVADTTGLDHIIP